MNKHILDNKIEVEEQFPQTQVTAICIIWGLAHEMSDKNIQKHFG